MYVFVYMQYGYCGFIYVCAYCVSIVLMVVLPPTPFQRCKLKHVNLSCCFSFFLCASGAVQGNPPTRDIKEIQVAPLEAGLHQCL